MSDLSGVNAQLKSMVEGHLEAHPHLTLNAFANRAGVSGTTLRRIVGAVTKKEPAPHTILNIVSYIFKEKNLGKLLNKTTGAVSEVLNDCFSNYATEDYDYGVDENLNDVLKDREFYFIYKLAANKKGTTRLEINDLLGQIGVQKIDDLIELGLVFENADQVIHACEKNFSLDLDTVKKHLPEMVKLYRPEELSLGRNLFYTISESVSVEAINMIKDIQREAVKRIVRIVNDERYYGDIPYFTINLCERFSSENSSRGVLQ